MVYTYVNGNDPKYLENIKLYGNINEIDYDKRYSNVNELNYSIKSVIKYLPFIRKIFIVTDNQIPDIDESLYKLKPIIIIDHKDIIDNKYLPTFYSDVIESCIHNISGLSDIFLYNNDDCFHFSEISISDIIFENSIKIVNAMSTQYPLIKNIYSKLNLFLKFKICYCLERFIKTENILKCEYSENIEIIYNHCTKIFRKSTLKYIETKYSSLLDELRKNKFRDNNSIIYNLFAMNIDNIINKNIIINIDNEKNNIYFFKCSGYNKNTDELLNDLHNLKPKFCCLSDIPYEYKNKFIEYMSLLI